MNRTHRRCSSETPRLGLLARARLAVDVSWQIHAMKNFVEARIVTQEVIERIDVDKGKNEGPDSAFLKRAIEVFQGFFLIAQTGAEPFHVPRLTHVGRIVKFP